MKRMLDIVAATTLLILLSPLMFAVAIATIFLLGQPVLFSQTRPGLGAKSFKMFKFRSMSNAVDASGKPLDDGKRLGRFGRFIRASSLDELPELWNVLKGEMSLVGPRPLLMEYLPLYTPHQFRRHEVRPGITGWAQVNGRNAISWEEKFELDVWYVDNQSFALDVKILLKTVQRVLLRQDINSEQHATMPPFRGYSGRDSK